MNSIPAEVKKRRRTLAIIAIAVVLVGSITYGSVWATSTPTLTSATTPSYSVAGQLNVSQ